jgi:DeoR family transcriptional regulator of aga operon
LDAVRRDASVEVSELAERFGVSASTIRRDLNELHRADLLVRAYGGAVTQPAREAPAAREAPFAERETARREEKERIGAYAATLVRPGETLILDGGTTCECLARHLREIPNLTVVTFGMNILAALTGAERVTVIGVGGLLDHRTQMFGGVLALDALAAYNLRFDKAFIAATGVSAESGVTNYGFEEIPLKRRAIDLSRETILLADASKVGAHAAGFIAPLERIHRLVTCCAVAEEQVAALRAAGMVIELV